MNDLNGIHTLSHTTWELQISRQESECELPGDLWWLKCDKSGRRGRGGLRTYYY